MTGKNIRNRVHGAGKSTEVAVGATGVIPYSDANLATYTHNLGAARPSVQSPPPPAREVGRGTMMIPFDGWLGTRLQPGLEEASAAGPGLELISLSTFTSRETGGGVPPGPGSSLALDLGVSVLFRFPEEAGGVLRGGKGGAPSVV